MAIENLDLIFESSPDLMMIAQKDGIIVAINPAGKRLLSLEADQDLKGVNFAQVFLESSHDWVVLADKMTKNGQVQDYEVVLRPKEGENRIVLLNGSLYPYANRHPQQFFLMTRDITERIQQVSEVWKMNLELAKANEEIQKAQERLIEKEKMASIGLLAAGVAHEINNPLGFIKSNFTTLKGYIDSFSQIEDVVLQKVSEPEKIKEILDEFEWHYIVEDAQAIMEENQKGFDRILEIVKSLKTFIYDEENRTLALDCLNKAIEDAIVISKNEWKYSTKLDFQPGEIPEVMMHKGEIVRVVLNLIVNGAHAIKKRGIKEGHILIKSFIQGEYVGFTIRDNGDGIPKDAQRKIFDPFFTTKPTGVGTGLGLSISHEIIRKKHNGHIKVRTKPGVGTEFTVLLPIKRSPE